MIPHNTVYFCILKVFLKKIKKFFIFFSSNYYFIFVFLDHFDVLILKMIFKK
jgi:hypothetical protein